MNYNPADFYIQILAVVPHKEQSCRETIAAICDSFEQSSTGIKLMTDIGIRHESQVKEIGLWCNKIFGFYEYFIIILS